MRQPVTDCRQEAVRRLLGFSRLEMKVKPKILASAVERTRCQAAGAFLRRVWESAVSVGLWEAQDPRQDWVRTLGAAGWSLLTGATGRVTVWRGNGKARGVGSSTSLGTEGQPARETRSPQQTRSVSPACTSGRPY